MKKVSLIMPCYNAAKYLEATLAAVLAQDYENIELVAVDDASTDSTLSILQVWRPEFEERGYELVIVPRERNGGLCAAINSGLLVYSGDYICFPDADDYMYPRYASALAQALDANPEYGWARCDYEVHHERTGLISRMAIPRRSVYKNDFNDFLSNRVPHNAWMLMVRREYFERCIGKQIHDSRLTQEWSLLFPLSYYGNYLRVPEILYRYILHPGSMYSWNDGDLNDVIEHNHSLKKLALDVLETMPLNSKEKDLCNAVLEVVYAFRICEAHKKRGHAYPEHLVLWIGRISRNYTSSGSVILTVEYLLDSMLDADKKQLFQSYCDTHAFLSSGYIVYGAGKICKSIMGELVSAYGVPKMLWDNNLSGDVNCICITKPDLSCEKFPVVILIANKVSLKEICTELQRNGFKYLMDVKGIVRSLRGFTVAKK